MHDVAGPQVRTLTDDEVAQFHDKGWVFLPGYLDPDYTAMLLDRAHGYFDYDVETAKVGDGLHSGVGAWDMAMDFSNVSRVDDDFKKVSYHPEMARNIGRLRPDEHGVRCYIDVAAAKLPESTGMHCGPTNFHQDFHAFPLNRALSVTCWIALDTVTPEMGSMRFFEGSDRDDCLMTQPDSRDIFGIDAVYERYPWLSATTSLAPPLTYQPGDATIHNSRIIHGAPGNTSTKARWNYAASYFPAGAAYTGMSGHLTNDKGLAVGQPLEHPDFPLVSQQG